MLTRRLRFGTRIHRHGKKKALKKKRRKNRPPTCCDLSRSQNPRTKGGKGSKRKRKEREEHFFESFPLRLLTLGARGEKKDEGKREKRRRKGMGGATSARARRPLFLHSVEKEGKKESEGKKKRRGGAGCCIASLCLPGEGRGKGRILEREGKGGKRSRFLYYYLPNVRQKSLGC